MPDPTFTAVDEITRRLDAARAAFNLYRLDAGEEELRAAQELATRASAAVPTAVGLRIRLTGTWLTFERRGLAAAEADLATLRRDCEDAGEAGLMASCDLQRGTLRARAGDLAEAVAALRRAEAGRAQMHLHDQVRLVLQRGSLAYQAGDLDGAVADLTAAARLATAAGLRTQQFKALHNLGCAEFVRGDLPTALRLMDQAAALDVPANRGITEVDRARVLVEAGLLHSARVALREAAKAFTDGGHHHEVAELQVDLARCELLLGDAASASRRAAAAAATFRTRGEPVWQRRAMLVHLMALGASGRPAELSRRIRVAGTLSRAVGPRAEPTGQAARVELAEALCDRGGAAALALAASTLDGARGLSRSPYLAARLSYAHARARVDLAGGRPQASRLRLARAAEDLAVAQRRTAGLDARTALAIHARRLADLDVGLALASGDPLAVLHRVERWRRAVAPLTPVRPSTDPDEAFLLGRLRQAREALAQGLGPRGELRTEVRRLERATSAARWRSATIAPEHSARPPTYGSVRAAVRTAHERGAAVVALVVIAGHVTAVLAVPGSPAALAPIGPAAELMGCVGRVAADVDAAARAAPDSRLGPMVAAAAADSLAALDRLLAPALEAVGRRPLVVLAGELFGAIPWGLLPGRRGGPTTLAPSLIAWAQAGRAQAGRTAPNVVLPVGEESVLDPPTGTWGGVPGAGPRIAALAGPGVAHGGAEAAAVDALWAARTSAGGGSSRETPCASRDDLIRALATADVVHVAAHGEHQPESPLFSSLRLADGPLFAHELESHPPSTSLVVLSACEAGRGTARPGEEALGWPSALLALGVRTVIAPLVAVRDDATYALMTALHRALAHGLSADAALAAAAGPAGTPFVCFGAPWSATWGLLPSRVQSARIGP